MSDRDAAYNVVWRALEDSPEDEQPLITAAKGVDALLASGSVILASDLRAALDDADDDALCSSAACHECAAERVRRVRALLLEGSPE